MATKLIGHVGVDSGQLLLCDPCYIDSQWEKEDFEDFRTYQHKDTGNELTFRIDFMNYQESIEAYGGKNMNELIATGEWEKIPGPKAQHPFSYNACAHATLSENGHGELKYKNGNEGVGVVFSTAFGDGFYPVVAHYHRDGTLRSVEVVFQNDEDDDDIDDYYENQYGDKNIPDL
jgi:hypothetical protein